MAELMIVLFIAAVYVVYGIAALLWRFLAWLLRPLTDAIASRREEAARQQRLLEEAREKEKRLLAAHRRALQEVDQTVAHWVQRQAQAMERADRQPGRRQSG
jgi:hypothetical protein